jgi:hypothetical protein
MRRWTFPLDLFHSRRCQRNPFLDKSLGCHRREWGCLYTPLKRRARGSNPQPLTGHHISSVAANHSLTLRNCLRNIILRLALLPVKGHFALCSQRARKSGCIWMVRPKGEEAPSLAKKQLIVLVTARLRERQGDNLHPASTALPTHFRRSVGIEKAVADQHVHEFVVPRIWHPWLPVCSHGIHSRRGSATVSRTAHRQQEPPQRTWRKSVVLPRATLRQCRQLVNANRAAEAAQSLSE